MKAMFLTKLRFATAVLVTLGAIFGLLAHHAWAAQPPAQDNRVADTSQTKDAAESQLVADQPNPPKQGEMPPAKPDPPKPTIWQEKATARAREVEVLAFAPDGRTLVCSQRFRDTGDPGSASGISILDAATLKELHSFKHQPGAARFVGFGADGKALVLRGVGNKNPKNELEFKEAELIELATGERRAVIDHGYWSDARLSPDGKILVTARQGHVSLFDATTGKTLDRFLARGDAFMDRLAFADGNTLLVLAIQSTFIERLSPHDLTTYDMVARKTLGSYNSATADGRKYAQAFRFDTPNILANKRVTEYLTALKSREGEELSPYTSALAPDGKTLALNWRPQQHRPKEQQPPARVQLIDLDSGKEITSLPAPGGASAVSFSPDGKRLVVGTSPGVVLTGASPAVILWESADASFVTIDGSDKTVKPGDFGYRIETATADGRVTVRISLNEEAVRSFGEAQLHLTRDGKTVLKTTIALQRDADNRSGTLELTLDKGTSDDGELLLRSRPIATAPSVKDFGGFRLSVKRLLGSAPSK